MSGKLAVRVSARALAKGAKIDRMSKERFWDAVNKLLPRGRAGSRENQIRAALVFFQDDERPMDQIIAEATSIVDRYRVNKAA